MKKLSLVLLLCWIGHATSPYSQSGIVFCNGFEGVKQEIADAWGSPNAGYFMAADPGPFNVAGNQVLKLSAGGGGVEVKKHLPAKYDRLYARWYQRWDSGYNWAKADHQGLLFASGENTAGTAYYPDGCKETTRMLLESFGSGGNGTLHWYVYQPGKNLDPDPNKWNPWGVTYQTGAPVTSGRWYCLEAMVDLGMPTPSPNGANGSIQLWVDGQRVFSQSGLWFRTCDSLKLSIVDIMTYARAEWVQPGISVYYDDVVVSTQPIGTGTRVDYAPTPLSITTTTLADAKKDSLYSAWISATGGIKPYSWTVSNGLLPQGLVMNPVAGNLNIKGISSVAGAYLFTLQVKDSGTGQTATQAYTLNIKPISGSGLAGSRPAISTKIAWKISSGRLVFRLAGNDLQGAIRIYDASGRQIWSKITRRNSLLVQSPVFSNGIYAGRFQSGREYKSFRFAIVR